MTSIVAGNVTWERFKFFSRKQQINETMEAFVSDLNSLSFSCELGNMRDVLVKDIMICGLTEALKDVQHRLLALNPATIDEALQNAHKLVAAIKTETESLSSLEPNDCRPCKIVLKSKEISLKVEEIETRTNKLLMNTPLVVANAENSRASSIQDSVIFHEKGKRNSKNQLRNEPSDNSTVLKQHQKEHIGRYICQLCGASLKKMNSLNRHMQSHSGERPYMCSECGKRFIRKGALDAHLTTHNEHRPFVCNHCNKAFASKLYLFIHIRIHTGDKPYQCQFCGKRFAQKSTLNVHLRSNHTKETPYKCLECDKAFVYKKDLDVHNFFHTGETPFICLECGKSFKRQSYLNTHRIVHSKERPYKCSNCNKTFKSKKHLNRHCMHCEKVREIEEKELVK